MKCRLGCGACCTAISISSPIPGLPNGKPAGERCPHLDVGDLCGLFGKPERPDICSKFTATVWLCGSTREQAFERIIAAERLTQS